MSEIVVARIDDRLIHGQIVTAWVKQYHCSVILIADDGVAGDAFMQRVLRSAAPADLAVKALSLKDAADYLLGRDHASEKVMLLVKVPESLEHLVDDGVALPAIVLGGMGAKAGRKKFNRNVSASDEEVKCLKRLEGKGCHVQFQLVPDDRPVPLEKLL